MFVGWSHNVVKMIVLPKAIYRYNEIPKKKPSNPTNSVFRSGKADSEVHMKFQGIPKSWNNLEKEKQVWRLILLDFKIYHKAAVIKIMVLV